jgi:hypothetical protein
MTISTKTTTTGTNATQAQVRAHYKAEGCEIKITRDGHVTYRHDGGIWLEGRWVEEYYYTAGDGVRLR